MELGVVSVAVAAAAGFSTALFLRRKQSPRSPNPASAYRRYRGLREDLGFPGLKGLDQLRSFAGTAKVVSRASYGNTAENPVKEQASVKTLLDIATKLKKTMEQIHVLEAKLQATVNENAKLKVRQTEDAKLWRELDSKLSSTKTLYDQHLVCQARAAEEEKKILEEKLVDNSKAFDNLSMKLNDLTMQLETADNTIRIGNREMLEVRHEKEELEKTFRDERAANENAIKGKDAVIKQLEDAVEENSVKKTLDFQWMQQELMLKEEVCKSMRVTQENLENEKATLEFSIQDFTQKLDVSHQRAKESADLVNLLTDKITYLFLEKDLDISSAQDKYDQLEKQACDITSEKNALNSEVSELKKKIIELQKAQEINTEQHVEECRLAEDKIRGLEHESEALVSKKNESEKLIAELELEVKHLTESASRTDIQMQELLQRFSRLESENNDLQDKVQTVSQEKAEEKETFLFSTEEEKKIFEEKLVEALGNSSMQLNDLTMQLETADNTIRIGNQEMLELRHEKEELEKTFRDERSAQENAIKGKGSIGNQQRDSDGGQGSSWGSGAGWSGRGNRDSDGGGRRFGGRDGGRGSRDEDGGGRGSSAGGWGSGRGGGGWRSGAGSEGGWVSGRGSGGGRNGDRGGQCRGFGGRYGAGRYVAGTSRGGWTRQKTDGGGNESSGCNNDTGNSWGKPKPWNDRPGGCDERNEGQSGWNSGKNVCWQGNTSDRGRGRGRNAGGGRFSSWHGRYGNDGSQGEFTGRGREGRGCWSGEGRGGSWNGGQRGRGGNWGRRL